MTRNPNKSMLWSVIIAIGSLIILSVLLSSCVTEKQRQRILSDCPTNSTETSSDSTWKKETVKYDSVFVEIVGPIRYFASPCATLCDSLGNIKTFKIETKKNGIKQTLQGVGNVLVQKCDIDSLLRVNSEKTTEINRLIQKVKETQVHSDCKLDHVSRLDSFFIITGRISLLILLIYALYRVLKAWISKYNPFG